MKQVTCCVENLLQALVEVIKMVLAESVVLNVGRAEVAVNRDVQLLQLVYFLHTLHVRCILYAKSMSIQIEH